MKSPEMDTGGPETPEKAATVRDIKNRFEAKFGTGDNWSDKQREFWAKLNNLGARNMDKMPPETVSDIDATVELSEEEVRGLEEEMNNIEK